MRKLYEHIVAPQQKNLVITVVDEPGAGGACHRYDITGFDTTENPSSLGPNGYSACYSRDIVMFQNGPVGEGTVNGVTEVSLLAILIDRMRCFQSGPFACPANAHTLQHLEEAMHWQHQRTLDRIRRGVEGVSAE